MAVKMLKKDAKWTIETAIELGVDYSQQTYMAVLKSNLPRLARKLGVKKMLGMGYSEGVSGVWI